MHDALFEERDLIPSGHYYEVRFEALESDPIGQMQSVYAALALPEFSYTRPALQRHLDSIRGYQKNTFPELSVARNCHLAL